MRIFSVRRPRHGRGGAHTVQRRSKSLRRSVDGQCGAIQLAQFIRIGMHVHQGLRRRGDVEQLIALRRHFRQPPAHHQHQIRRLDARQQLGVDAQAQVAAVASVRGREQHLAAERAVHGNGPRFGKRGELAHRLLRPAAAAQDGHRVLCGLQALRQLGHLRSAGVRFRHLVGQRVGHRSGLGQHVFGQRHHHRAGAARGGDVEGARDQFGHTGRVVNLHHPLGHGTEHRAVVQLLKRLAPHGVAGHLAHEQDHGRRILVRDVNARRGIGGTGPARHKADAGLARELALRLGHHGRAAFLATHGHADVGIVQRIEHGQVAFAGHAEELLHTMGDELLDQNLAAGAGGKISRVHINGIGSKIQNKAWQARWMRAQASCKSAVEAAYEMRKYGASPSTPPGTTATWCSRSR